MAQRPISPSPIDAPPVPQSRAANVSTTPNPSKEGSKGTIRVYDRLARTCGSWSPVTIIALILGVLFLLWVLGFFNYVLG